MALGKRITVLQIQNNQPAVTISKNVEANVNDDTLVPTANELNPGVNSRYQ